MSSQAPDTATHEWQPNDGYRNPWVKRLNYYRKSPQNEWEVYSSVTGWRKTTNDDTWFEEETAGGFFKEIK